MNANLSSRAEVLAQLADLICSVERPHPVRVAIDGIDAAGKTTLADELVPLVEDRGRCVIRASVDGFHNPKAKRYALGPDSPEGYYRDSFNLRAILHDLLVLLGSGGSRQYRREVYDYKFEKPVDDGYDTAPVDSILLFDGIFLHRPELVDYWDYSIYVDVDFDVSLSRAVRRNQLDPRMRMEIKPLKERYHLRYFPGQEIYVRGTSPKNKANIILNNNDMENPVIILA